ncbi:MAG: hypothetical protein JXA52_01085 [Planctomycetes bacterium]|nr:hypothetical protein [Planctomycetota bacterium]
MHTENEKTVPSIAQCFLKPPGWPLYVILGIAILWLLLFGLYPGFYYLNHMAFLCLVWCGLLLYFPLKILIQLILRNHYQVTAIKNEKAFKSWIYPFIILLIATVLFGFKVPLRIGFLTSRPGLERLANEMADDRTKTLSENIRCGLYEISAEATNYRRNLARDKNQRVALILANDHETGFIYSPDGIDDLVYNAGNSGHLLGDWYWMAED